MNQQRKTPLLLYQAALQRGFKKEPAQQQAIQALQACFEALEQNTSSQKFIQGIYLYGPVGRGKTWLMDCFYQCLTVPAKRMHFHHFIRWIHRRLFELTGQENPLEHIAKELADEVRVLCFDELFVQDIGDAILLGGLFSELFNRGLVIICTSNQHPDRLYEDGFNRARLLPTIETMKQHQTLIQLAGEQDHRLHPGEKTQRFWVKQPDALAEAFWQFTAEQKLTQKTHTEPLQLGPVQVPVLAQNDYGVWCRYQDLCERPLAPTDYIELCDRFQAVFLDQVPQLSEPNQQKQIARGTEDAAVQVAAGDRILPDLSIKDDGVRRFIALLDECYDRQVPLYINAEVPMDDLYPEGVLAFPFRRALSRLQEMQFLRYLEK